MTHILTRHTKGDVRSYVLGKPHAAVRVRVEGPALLRVHIVYEKNPDGTDSTRPTLPVLTWDAQLAPLPETIRVVGHDGSRVHAERRSLFVITTETFDPWHNLAVMPLHVWQAARLA